MRFRLDSRSTDFDLKNLCFLRDTSFPGWRFRPMVVSGLPCLHFYKTTKGRKGEGMASGREDRWLGIRKMEYI